MWPWGHAALGYLLYSLWTRGRRGRTPNPMPALAVTFGAVLPDLIDKPLAWYVDVLPTGRTLGHSLVFILPAIGVLWWISRERHHETVGALGFGWVSHLLGDGVGTLSNPAYLGYALWPATTTPPYETEQSFIAHLTDITPTPLFLAQIVLVVAALVVWYWDDLPGLRLVVVELPRSITSLVRSQG